VDAPLVIAGVLGVFAAGVHGIAGEVLVVRKLSLDRLASSPFGGARMTKAMIHATWHITTFAFLVAGVGMLIAGTALDGDAARAVGICGAAAFSGYGLLAAAMGGGYLKSPRYLLSHPGPAVLSATAALAWWGALSA